MSHCPISCKRFRTQMSSQPMLQQRNSTYNDEAVVWKKTAVRGMRSRREISAVLVLIKSAGAASILVRARLVFALIALWGSAARGGPKTVLKRLEEWAL